MMKPEPWVFTRRGDSPLPVDCRSFQVEMFTTAGVAFRAAAASPLSMARASAGGFMNGIVIRATSTGNNTRFILTSRISSSLPRTA